MAGVWLFTWPTSSFNFELLKLALRHALLKIYLETLVYGFPHAQLITIGGGGGGAGGVLRFDLNRGVPPLTIPIFKGHFGRKGTHFRDFSQNVGPFVTIFRCLLC